MNEVTLAALDGSNPIAFLAALGVLNVLSDRSSSGERPPTLAWHQEGAWRPVLSAEGELDEQVIVREVVKDLRSWPQEPALQLRYGKSKGGKAAWDLKPPPDVFVAYLKGLVEAAQSSRSRRSVDFAAAFATDVATDNSGNTKPTALHFTAGQQQFLDMVSSLAEAVTADDVAEALGGPWGYARDLPVLQWDNTSSRDYALRASDPSKDKKLGVPGADWLAFRGLSFMRVAPSGSKIMTAGCSGGWKTGQFRWPLWTVPLTRPAIQTLMTVRGLNELSTPVLRARGIGVIFEAGIKRSDQGGYGSFTPARAL